MNYPTTQPPNYPSTIDIILSVIDNYGDIGFACEFIAAWRREVGSDITFVIWTNQVSQVMTFVGNNQHLIGEVEIKDKSDFGKGRLSDIALAFFHADIPEIEYFTKGALVLRIDYLSFDKTWLVHHLDEHIASTSDRRIIEVIPSPIPESGGLLYPYDTSITRDILASTYDLDGDKNWILVFAYPSTLQDILTFDNIDEDTQVLVFGIERENMTFLQSTETRFHAVGPHNDGDMICMPWVDIATWHALVDESAWTLVRGEVSAVASIMRGKLAFWDMYKEIGGLNHEQSKDYLNMSSTDSAYRDIHERLNGQKTGGIYWSELEQYIQKNSIPQMYGRERTKNLITEIKKCIDSHEFSI